MDLAAEVVPYVVMAGEAGNVGELEETDQVVEQGEEEVDPIILEPIKQMLLV